jgi:predicted NUDIX family NTP pyrophosphohydrolase
MRLKAALCVGHGREIVTVPLRSAGIILYRRRKVGVEVLLVHPGGPFWRHRDEGAWMIPKGMVEPGEEPEAAALREFEEELGTRLEGRPVFLRRVRQAGGKWVEAYAMEGDLDPATISSNMVSIEFPPRSGRFQSYPEVDRAQWFPLAEAHARMLPSQHPILDALAALLEPG